KPRLISAARSSVDILHVSRFRMARLVPKPENAPGLRKPASFQRQVGKEPGPTPSACTSRLVAFRLDALAVSSPKISKTPPLRLAVSLAAVFVVVLICCLLSDAHHIWCSAPRAQQKARQMCHAKTAYA